MRTTSQAVSCAVLIGILAVSSAKPFLALALVLSPRVREPLKQLSETTRIRLAGIALSAVVMSALDTHLAGLSFWASMGSQ